MPEKQKPHLPYYLSTIGIFILLKVAYTQADPTDLQFLLYPTSQCIGWVTNTTATFIVDRGYLHENLQILIDKSCAGFNFMVLCFLMLSFLVYEYLKGAKQQVLALPGLLFVAYLLTLFVNSSRILFVIFLQRVGIHALVGQATWLHQAEGTFIYLFFLILIYLGFNFGLSALTQPYAKHP